MYYLATGNDSDTRFRNAILVAIAVHAALILAVSFNASLSTPPTSPQIEVTLATRPSAVAPEDATQIAQANQVGSGNDAALNQLTTRNPLQTENPTEQQAILQQAREQSARQHDTLVTAANAERRVTAQEADASTQQFDIEGISPEIDRINREIASLQAELDDETRTSADQPRVRRLTAASARQAVDAAYLLDWRRRLEAVGNQYYPQASIRYGLYGDLRMLVIIRNDGSLEDIQILSSSGYAVLDEAAIKIVRMAAPYSPFPPELRATTDKLEIVRTWHFQENQLSSP
ncbi:MAG: TonB family protein [Halioglobus sp.]|nr:TonB family protein [Halioglobus sp.]